MKCPDYHRFLLKGIGRDVLSGILVNETPWHKWPMGIMWDTWRVLVAVEAQDEFGGVVHVSLDYDMLDEEDHDRVFGSLHDFVELVGEQAEEAVESGDIESHADIFEGTLLKAIAEDGYTRPYTITGTAIDLEAA